VVIRVRGGWAGGAVLGLPRGLRCGVASLAARACTRCGARALGPGCVGEGSVGGGLCEEQDGWSDTMRPSEATRVQTLGASRCVASVGGAPTCYQTGAATNQCWANVNIHSKRLVLKHEPRSPTLSRAFEWRKLQCAVKAITYEASVVGVAVGAVS